MTENERLNEALEDFETFCEGKALCVTGKALEMVRTAVKEARAYRAIGTVEELQELKGVITDFPLDCGDTVTTVKEILHQLSEYLKIGTIEEFKALKEKSVAKKAIAVDSGVYDYLYDYECPNCRENVDELDHHCNCGQKLDWSEE